MSTDLKISQLTPATTVNTNDYTVMVDGNTSANKRATVAQILAIAGAGTVTSINVSGANGINSSGGPITSSGTIALSLGAITPTSIVASGTISGSNLSNTNSGDQAITIVGDVTAPASTGTLTATLANSVVTNDKLADMVGPTVKGRTSGTGIPQDLSTAQVTAMLPEMVADSGTGGSKGLVPPPTAGSAAAKKFLRADATWVATDLNDILPSQSGNIGKVLQTSGTTTSWQAVGVGSVTNVSVTNTGNGVSGTVANSSTVPAISLTLGAITPSSVNSVVLSGTSTPTLAVTGTSSISGSHSGSSSNTNTGDQTTITGNAGSATALATGRTIAITGDLAYTSPSFDGTANVTAAGTLATVATAGTSGGSTAIPVVTINAKGLTTSITTAAVIAPAGTLSGNTLASGVTASSLTSLGTIANLAVTAGTISGTPSASTDIANKLYVDTVAQGLDAKASCVAATTADITLSGTQTIDGISVIAADRVLVKNQTLSQNNGIYLCAAGAWTRTTDADTWDELTSAFTFIETGTVNADCGFVCTANGGGTLGTTALPWSQFSGAGSYTASTGLTLTGTAFSLTTPVAVANGGTGISSFGAGVATFLGTPSSANLAAAVTDETGSGVLVFGTSPTITTPVIAQINDANGNETLKLASIASAVNEVTIENAATGSAVHISATGGDASVGLHLAGKGASGYVNVQDSVDATKRILFNASGGTTNTRTMLSSTQTVDRTLSLPDATDTLVGKATTDTLTNKTLTSPTITGGALNGTLGATTPSSVAATTGTFSSTLGVTGVATLGNGAILGTPASGTVTNLTGTASININGTVGATTPSTVAGTTGTFSGKIRKVDSITTTVDWLEYETGWTNPSGNKSIIWKDTTSPLGRISVSYAGGVSSMSFGSLYSGGYLTADSMVLTTTGAAITGTLSATGTISTSAGQLITTTAGAALGSMTGGANAYFDWSDGTTTSRLQMSGGVLYFGTASGGGTIYLRVNASTIGTLTSTGLAVTGTLSASGVSTLTGGAVIQGLTVGRGAGAVASNTAVGASALAGNSTGSDVTAVGNEAYRYGTAVNNTAFGSKALGSAVVTGSENTAIGRASLYSNTSGTTNTAVGSLALFANTTASYSTAVGYQAGYLSTGGFLTAVGYLAGYSSTSNTVEAFGYEAAKNTSTGTNVTAIGTWALLNNTSGSSIVAVGRDSLKANTTGSFNTAVGMSALVSNTTATQCTAVGYQAGNANTTGGAMVAIGTGALATTSTADNCTAVGVVALSGATGGNNTALGFNAGGNVTSGTNNTCIGNSSATDGVRNITTGSNEIVMGNNSHTAAYIKIAWTVSSDARDKTSFAPVPLGLDFVNSLTPTAYQFRVSRDDDTPTGPIRYGFKAQDILAAEGSNSVIIDSNDPENLKYNSDSLIATLVNSIKELTARLAALESK